MGHPKGRRPSATAWVSGLAATVVVLTTYQEELVGRLIGPLAGWTAAASVGLLDAAGLPVWRDGSVLGLHGGQSYEVYFRCSGYLPVALLCIAILVWPATPRQRIIGLVAGIPALLALNLVRIVHLVLIGAATPAFFALAHKVLWEGGMALAVLGLWMAWKKWATMNVSLPDTLSGGGQ